MRCTVIDLPSMTPGASEEVLLLQLRSLKAAWRSDSGAERTDADERAALTQNMCSRADASAPNRWRVES